jgi:hypothetical protein
MANARDRSLYRRRLVAMYEGNNRRAAAILLAVPDRYPGLPQQWAESFAERSKSMPTHFEEGRYHVKIVNQHFIASPVKKTLGFTLTFRVVCNLDQPEAPLIKSYQRDVTWWITEKTAKRFLHDLHALGYSGTTLSGVDPDTEDFHDFRGQEIALVCKHERNEKDEVFERWSFENSKPNLEDKSQLGYFDRLLNDGGRPVNDDAETPRISDSDVPF